jgi:hypothetical protein
MIFNLFGKSVLLEVEGHVDDEPLVVGLERQALHFGPEWFFGRQPHSHVIFEI